MRLGGDRMDEKIKKFALGAVAVLLFALFFWAALKYIFPVLLPFGLAYLISAGIRPLASFLSKKTKLSKKVLSIILIVLCVLIIVCLLWFLGSTLVREIKEVLSGAQLSEKGSPVRKISDKMKSLMEKARLFGGQSFIDVEKMQTTAISKAASALADFVGGLVKSAPSFLFFTVVMILSLFYFSCDMEGVKRELSKILPEKIMNKLKASAGLCICALGRFAKAYLSLFCITFGVVTAGFFIIGIKYPFLGALLCAFVDMLPVFGVGSVLLPWSVFLFLTGETGKAVGMLILLLVMYALRQILEPRIVGGAAGVHPVVVLFGVFLGFKLIGVGGMIIAPLLINGVSVFLEEKRKKLDSKVDKRE